jgi:uncharacterized iron-regulated membrane protein
MPAEITRSQHPEAYRAAGPATMSFAEVAEVVERHDSAFRPQSLYRTHGVIVADDFESGRRVSVDPSNGQVLADFNPVTEGGFVATAMGLLYNLHLCLLSCEEYPGYQRWLAAQVPGSAWAGFEGEKVTWGGLLLGVMGLLLLFLAVSGVWLWWPGVKHWVRGVRVRWRKGRYARDYDLHQVAGMLALPLLLAWPPWPPPPSGPSRPPPPRPPSTCPWPTSRPRPTACGSSTATTPGSRASTPATCWSRSTATTPPGPR